MPRKETEDLVRVHIWLYKRDLERFHHYYGRSLEHGGQSLVFRKVINDFFNRLDAKASARIKPLSREELQGKKELSFE